MALDAMRNAPFLKTAKYQEQQGRAVTEGADPLICLFSYKVIQSAAKLGIPLFAHTIVRSYDDQASAYVRGVSWTNPDKVPWPHRAFAVDIIHSQYGWMDNPPIPHAWDVVGHIGFNVAQSMDIDIRWGGDWNGNGRTDDERKYDPAHFELADWRTRYAEYFPHPKPKET